MHPRLLIATSNPGKFREIAEFLRGVPFQLTSLDEVNVVADFHEDGGTFRENAIGKAQYYAQKSGLRTLAEDSGIVVDALKDALGVKTRRWGKGENASDEEWVEYFLKVMDKVSLSERTASFYCEAALVDPGGAIRTYEGATRGLITQTLEAPIQKGLPLSSCFRPDGFEHVYAALSTEEKNRISHRGKAMAKVREALEKEGK